LRIDAVVVELVDTPDLGSGARKSVKVRVLSAALQIIYCLPKSDTYGYKK
tara:strand:+ start:110 stop:259 length:150 start_codon:yes stop_codon:yes gene_type:complete